MHTVVDKSLFSSMSGASYNTGTVRFSMQHSGETLQNMAIFSRIPTGMGSSTRATMMSGVIPIPCSSLTECCVGLLLNSHEPLI